VWLAGEARMRDVEGSYRALLAVTNVLNSQRDTDSLWRAITEQIRRCCRGNGPGSRSTIPTPIRSGFMPWKPACPIANCSAMPSSRRSEARSAGCMTIGRFTCARSPARANLSGG